jgi:hypothetical protein
VVFKLATPWRGSKLRKVEENHGTGNAGLLWYNLLSARRARTRGFTVRLRGTLEGVENRR